MTYVALILCLFMVAVAALGVVSPPRLLGVLRKIQTPRGLILIGVLRVILGVALILSAPASKAPELITVVGVIAIFKGVTLPLIGVERLRRLFDWWSALGDGVLRGWALLATAIGLLVSYAIIP